MVQEQARINKKVRTTQMYRVYANKIKCPEKIKDNCTIILLTSKYLQCIYMIGAWCVEQRSREKIGDFCFTATVRINEVRV